MIGVTSGGAFISFFKVFNSFLDEIYLVRAKQSETHKLVVSVCPETTNLYSSTRLGVES
jgi:hypothetical protein